MYMYRSSLKAPTMSLVKFHFTGRNFIFNTDIGDVLLFSFLQLILSSKSVCLFSSPGNASLHTTATSSSSIYRSVCPHVFLSVTHWCWSSWTGDMLVNQRPSSCYILVPVLHCYFTVAVDFQRHELSSCSFKYFC